ncbi:MAG: thioredoxin domain-containing protein [Gammaproteobacteria bacterium]|nr:thioredoxin domain-containing protein [Gammaproteobacteria bacterium]
MSTNRLHDATSPYLQQHANNPVDWWPWCEEALEKARREDRPILLSIGYSACHWCHVMAHESFEDPVTADVMNALYVNIKVDREERPDLDRIYQTAHQLLARRAGGWPLTVFLSPDDLAPFFAGTYFPPQPRHGLPSFVDLLRQIEKAYREQRDAIREQNATLQAALVELDAVQPDSEDPDGVPLASALNQLAGQFDARHGGFGGAPKFPHPATLRFVLHQGMIRAEDATTHIALHTLQQMANGGINDHVGGGFCRYSVDERWMIPHFEKMLYDNGQLLGVYAEAWALAGHRPLFKHVCERTAEWVVREMQAPDGGYYASLDADSEGVEGKYYVWTPAEVVALLEDAEYRVFAPRYGLDHAANFEGHWHLHVRTDTDTIAERTGLGVRDVRGLLLSARQKLYVEREKRVRPGRDEKILTSWNALMIRGMAIAGRTFERADWLDSARAALDYLRRRHWRDGRLLATSRNGDARLSAYLDDHVFLIDAVLEMLQARWDSGLLAFAVTLAERVLDGFEDHAAGGFFFTASDHEALLHRPRPLADDALPSGNGIAITVLLRLAHLTGDMRFHDAATRALHAAWPILLRAPYAHVGLLDGLQQWLEPPAQVVLRGPAAMLPTWLQTATAAAGPGDAVYAIEDDAGDLPAALAAMPARTGSVVAYLCRGRQCEPPVDTLEDLRRVLGGNNGGAPASDTT